MDASDLRLFRSRVTGNGVGLRASQSRVKLSAVTASNASQDLVGDSATSIRLSGEVGASSLPKAPNWTNSFACPNGSRIDIDAGGLSTVLGTKYDFLTCLHAH